MSARTRHTILTVLMLLSLISQPLAASAAPPAQAAPTAVAQPAVAAGPGALFRTTVTADSPSRRARLEALGVVVLTEDEGRTTNDEEGSSSIVRPSSVVVLADADQFEALARLGFRPQASDDLAGLAAAAGPEKAWLAKSLVPLLAQAEQVQQQRIAAQAVGAAAATPDGLASLHAAMQALTPEQAAGIAGYPSNDFDGDGLTDTEEAWWCTDPANPNSDGDAQGFTDGQEVQALLDVTQPRNVRWGYGPPFGPPAAWPNFNNRDGTGVKVCNDGDFDTIPDYAEVFMVGTRVPYESTDNDKFDDGQELFGVTYCPGAPTNCGYGSYPAVEYWNFIKAPMPNWVLPPGDSPFVAAFPVPEVTVEANSWTVERVTTITTSQGEIVEKTNSYETAVTRGQSTSIANTVTWNEWEEVSQAVERPLASAAAIRASQGGWNRVWGGVQMVGGTALAAGAVIACTGATAVTIGAASIPCVPLVAGAAVVGGALVGEGWGDLTNPDESPDVIQNTTNKTTNYNDYSYNPDYYDFSEENNISLTLNQTLDSQGIVNSLDGVQYAINQQGALLSRGLQDISYQISRPRLTETRTSGKSWGGAQTTTHEVYEEHTISQGEAFTSGQNWSTAWAVDSSHAADLTFRYSVRNAGTEYARELSNLVFNIYIGDDKLPIISYPAWEQFAGGKLDNLFPVGPNTPPGVVSTKTFATNPPIPLSLEQMKRIDLGERLTVKVESFSFGADELFYTDAINGGVTVFIEDGVEDSNETVDQYVIPTWGAESVQDVLTRYFPHAEDADGNLNSLWTPEFSGIDAPTWHEHYLSDIAWWNVYLTQADGGDTPLHQLPARAGSGILFRFNRDSDRDGYNDRAEFRYYCALPASHVDRPRCADGYLRPEIHPQPEVLAGYVVERSGNIATAKLALENTGTFDAYGIDAVMYSPDATTTIGNNTVGGNGKVRPGNRVTVGSMVKAPDLGNWGASRARPYAAGEYSGAVDRTFTFTAQTPGVVGTGSTAVAWNNGAGASGVLQVGGSYHAPLPLDVALGVQVGFNTGTIDAGARFTVQALTSRDTFTYTINSEPFTPPVIVVSYSDPQGSHRFVTPVQLPALGDSLAPHVDAMLAGLELKIVSTAAFIADGVNTTNLVVYNPHPATIEDGHLHLNFISDGKLVLEKSHTLDIPAGPTTFAADWSVAEFAADYNPNGDNLLIAFWTDSENNIIDSAARPLNSFAADPKPAAASDAAAWDFGTVTQGEVLKRKVSVASVGELDLLAYVSASPGLVALQVGSRPLGLGDVTSYELTLDTRTLPTGPYSGTATLRTSDPAHPLYTVQVSGEIQAAGGDAYARTVTDRPLDVEVWVSGDHSQGEWITTTHTLAPNPELLHPIRLLSSDRNTLLGVGEYATVNIATPFVLSTVIPYLDSNFRYLVGSTVFPPDYYLPSFDDATFSTGSAAFGSVGACGLANTVRSSWPVNSYILIRKAFNLPPGAKNLRIGVAIDNDIWMFLNGVNISGGMNIHEGCATRDSFVFSVPDTVLADGENLIAVLGLDRGAESYLDIQAVADIPDIAVRQSGDAPNTLALRIPYSFSDNEEYIVQYGWKLYFAAAGEMTTTRRVPAGLWIAATLDALVSGVGSCDVTFKLDVGADGVWDWEETRSVTNAATFSSPDLAAAFAPYVNGVGQVDVPVNVYLSQPGQVLLTNMAVTRNQSVELAPALTLAGSPTEGTVVPLNANITNSGTVDSGPFTVSYYAVHSPVAGPQYIGSVFVPNVPRTNTVAAPFQWNTMGFTGPVTVTVTIDPFDRVAETDETNNSASAVIPILTRPDLSIPAIALSDAEPVTGRPVTVTVTVRNTGQTAAGSQTTTLYNGHPDAGGTAIGNRTVASIAGGGSRNATFTWTPAKPGPYRLFARADRTDVVKNESNEGNNDRWRDVYVGFGAPIAVDSGAPAADPLYTAARGYGAVDTGEADAIVSCAGRPDPTLRRDPSNQVGYRFDHLQPGRFYHLDVILYECDNNHRVQRVLVDDMLVGGPVSLGDQAEHRLSIRLDPALYRDHEIRVAVIGEDGSQRGAVVASVALREIDYRYADSGGPGDLAYTLQRGWGYLAEDNTLAMPNSLPYRSARVNQAGTEVRYQFDRLDPAKRYQVALTFWQATGNPLQQRVRVDGLDTPATVNVVAGTAASATVRLSPLTYAEDGSAVVSVAVLNAETGAMVNEISLEEETLLIESPCRVRETAQVSFAYGSVVANDVAAPAGTVVTAHNPAGEIVGCYVVGTDGSPAGQYGFVPIYGEDASASPPIPGMKEGQLVTFRVDGALAAATPAFYWHNDLTDHRADLVARRLDGQSILLPQTWNSFSFRLEPPVPLVEAVLGSTAGKYDRVFGEEGVWDANVPPQFRTLTELHAGRSYYLRLNGVTSANLLIEGSLLPADTPLPLHAGWNWVGYLPQTALPITVALNSIAGSYQRVLGTGGQFYDVRNPAFSTLKQMAPGQGYRIYATAPVTLTYPAAAVATAPEPEAEAPAAPVGPCRVAATPNMTFLFGALIVDDRPAPAGALVEALTPRGEIAGCFVVETPGQYGFMPLFGEDPTATPPIPGFRPDEPIRLRVNGLEVALDAAPLWQDDLAPRQVDLAFTPYRHWLPLIAR